MGDAQLTTVFRFVCSNCQQANEYQQTHPPQVRPHLVSRKCSSCHALNRFGGLKGTVLDVAPVAAEPGAASDLAIKQQ